MFIEHKKQRILLTSQTNMAGMMHALPLKAAVVATTTTDKFFIEIFQYIFIYIYAMDSVYGEVLVTRILN